MSDKKEDDYYNRLELEPRKWTDDEKFAFILLYIGFGLVGLFYVLLIVGAIVCGGRT